MIIFMPAYPYDGRKMIIFLSAYPYDGRKTIVGGGRFVYFFSHLFSGADIRFIFAR